jgi:hypothetical protein
MGGGSPRPRRSCTGDLKIKRAARPCEKKGRAEESAAGRRKEAKGPRGERFY